MTATKLPAELRPHDLESRWSQTTAPSLEERPSQAAAFTPSDDLADNEILTTSRAGTMSVSTEVASRNDDVEMGTTNTARPASPFASADSLVDNDSLAARRATTGSVSTEVASRDDDVEMGEAAAAEPASAFASFRAGLRATSVVLPEATRWICSDCDEVNKAERNQCNNCGRKREATLAKAAPPALPQQTPP